MVDKEYLRKYRIKNRRKIYEKQKEWRDKNRERLNEINLKSRWKNIEKNRDYARRKHLDDKMKVLKYYSITNPPSCECCGESHIEFLTIDHIYGDGNKHKEEIKRRNFHPWLIKNNFPPGFRVLCFNCNCSLGFHGYCPHGNVRKEIKTGVEVNAQRSLFS